jgi:hypothetical protein
MQLIHTQNSLDVVPNSVAQVAAAIEEKRTAHCGRTQPPTRIGRRPSQSVQGRAFAAPRMQSLDRMRTQAKDLQELGQILDQSPRKFNLRRTDSNWDYHTPPSNRKGRIVATEDMADLQQKLGLRRVQSNETIQSKATTVNRGNSMQSRRGGGSVLGFREAEVREDMELGGLGITGEAPFRQRLEQSRERQYRFSKKRSVEKWKGVAGGWLKGNIGAKDGRRRDG